MKLSGKYILYITTEVMSICVIIFLFLITGSPLLSAQQILATNGINYQGLITDPNGDTINIALPFEIKFTIIGCLDSAVEYQETQFVYNLKQGLFNVAIGSGQPTPQSINSELNQINPIINNYCLIAELNLNNTGFQVFEKRTLLTVPFSITSMKLSDSIKINNLKDVSLSYVTSDILKWDGNKWIQSKDKICTDSANFAVYSNHSINSAYSLFGYIDTIAGNVDSVKFAIYTDTVNFSEYSDQTGVSSTTGFAQNVLTADSAKFIWNFYGNKNLINPVLGTSDSTDLMIKTNSTERLRIDVNGNIIINDDSSAGGLSILGDNGVLIFGNACDTSWSDADTTSNASVFMFDVCSGSFRAGTFSDTALTSKNVLNKSFAFGRHLISNGNGSPVVFGDSCEVRNMHINAQGYSAFVFGKNSIGNGQTSVTIGYNNKSLWQRDVAIGNNCTADLNAQNHAVGSYCTSLGSASDAIGYRASTTSHYSTALGNYCSTSGKQGSFVFGDYSTSDTVKNTASNQFMIRSAGGVIFYTDTSASVGVEIPSGSGAWNMMSDSTLKENFTAKENFKIYSRINNLNIYYWNYKSDPTSALHISPTSQSFYKLYKLGENNKTISALDLDGICSLLIQNISDDFKSNQKKLDEMSNSLSKTELDSFYNDIHIKIEKINNQLKSLK